MTPGGGGEAAAKAGAIRRLARKRAALAAQRERIADAAGLLADGRFADARAVIAAATSGSAGDPRVRLRAVADAPPLLRPVFVCGLHRSGTSLLVDRLRSRFDLAWIQNVRVPEAEGQFLQDVYPQEMPFGGPGNFAFAPQMRLRPVTESEAARRLAARLSACWTGCAAGGGRLLEKSPSNLVRIAYLRSLFPDARFVVWTRDPRAVSMATRKWSKRTDLKVLMLHWCTAYLTALEDMGDDCIIARYEDFCDDPDATLERIGRFCDLDRRPEPLPAEKRFGDIRNSNDRYTVDFPSEAMRIEGIAAWELFGYRMPAHRRVQAEGGDKPASEATPLRHGRAQIKGPHPAGAGGFSPVVPAAGPAAGSAARKGARRHAVRRNREAETTLSGGA